VCKVMLKEISTDIDNLRLAIEEDDKDYVLVSCNDAKAYRKERKNNPEKSPSSVCIEAVEAKEPMPKQKCSLL